MRAQMLMLMGISTIVMNLDGGPHLLRNDLEAQHHSLGFTFSNDWAGASMRCPSQTEPSTTNRSVVEWYKIQPWLMAADWAR